MFAPFSASIELNSVNSLERNAYNFPTFGRECVFWHIGFVAIAPSGMKSSFTSDRLLAHALDYQPIQHFAPVFGAPSTS